MLKYYEYARHSMGEPLVTAYVYKKAEGGKITSVFKAMFFSDWAYVIVHEEDDLRGGEVLNCGKGRGGLEELFKFYDPEWDDFIVVGEKNYVDELLSDYLSKYDR